MDSEKLQDFNRSEERKKKKTRNMVMWQEVSEIDDDDLHFFEILQFLKYLHIHKTIRAL